MYREKIDDHGHFKDILPDGYELYMSPKLPKISFKRDKVIYTVTDIRYVNETANNTLSLIISAIADSDTPDIDKVSVTYNAGIDDDKIEIVTTILTSLRASAKKGGKYAWNHSGCFLITGTIRKGNTIEYLLDKWQAQSVREYCRERTDKNVEYFDLVPYVLNKSRERMIKALEERGE